MVGGVATPHGIGSRRLLLLSVVLALAATVVAATSPSNCQYCHIREEQKRAQIEAIKAQILQKLGMQQEPNMTGRKLPNVTDALREIYLKDARAQDQDSPRDQQYFSDEDDDDHSQLEKMWTFASRCEYSWSHVSVSAHALLEMVMQCCTVVSG